MSRVAARYRRQQPARFEVADLHNRFTYHVDLPAADRPLRFLSAPNGYGKSTLLQMIDDLTHYRLEALARTIYRQATLGFDSGAQLTVTREVRENHAFLTFKCMSPNEQTIEQCVVIVLPKANWIRRTAHTGFEITETGEPLYYKDVTSVMPSDAPTASKPEELGALVQQLGRVLGVPAVYYLDAQRLRHDMRDEAARAEIPDTRGDGSEYAVNQVSSRIAGIIRRVSYDYGRTSRAADRAYLPRALKALRNARPDNQINPQALTERYSQLRQQESNLQSLALTDGVMDAISEEECRSTDQTALLLLDQFLDDVERRFAVLERTAKQLALFRDTLNSMFEHKTIGFNSRLVLGQRRRIGIYAISDEGQEIPLTSLSSGEQHLIVMFGRILFDSDCINGGLVLLDEPEISLHPQWQMALSRALKEVAVLNKCRMLLATHSPTMIGNDWDSETALSPLEEA